MVLILECGREVSSETRLDLTHAIISENFVGPFRSTLRGGGFSPDSGSSMSGFLSSSSDDMSTRSSPEFLAASGDGGGGGSDDGDGGDDGGGGGCKTSASGNKS